jgi:magnesium transporter
MEIFVYRPNDAKVEEGFSLTDLPELLKDEANVVWLDLENPTEADEKALVEIFHFHPLTLEDCRENRNYPKIEEFPGYLYFIVHGVQATTTAERFNTIELDGFLGRNYVITYHHDVFRSINNVKQLIRTTPVPCQRGAAFLLYQILDQIVDYYTPILDDFDERIDRLEDDIFSLQRPNKQMMAQIMDLKRAVLRLRRISSRQMEIFYRMGRGEFPIIEPAMLPFFRDTHDHMIRIVDLSESYRDLLGGVLDAYLSVVSNRMNEIMKVLTIFSAIMLPLTFIAGVYGMNFDNMPELHSTYGYFAVLILMVLVAVLMLYFFWKRGWLGAGPEEGKSEEG